MEKLILAAIGLVALLIVGGTDEKESDNESSKHAGNGDDSGNQHGGNRPRVTRRVSPKQSDGSTVTADSLPVSAPNPPVKADAEPDETPAPKPA